MPGSSCGPLRCSKLRGSMLWVRECASSLAVARISSIDATWNGGDAGRVEVSRGDRNAFICGLCAWPVAGCSRIGEPERLRAL